MFKIQNMNPLQNGSHRTKAANSGESANNNVL